MHLSFQNGDTPLIQVSYYGHMECVQLFLDKGAEVNMQNKVNQIAE